MLTGFHVSTDRHRMNVPWVCAQLKATYWGGWYDDLQIQRAMENSLCVGVFADDVLDGGEIAVCGEQVAFARVVTDRATYSSMMDVIVAEEHRNKGIGSMLVEAITKHPDVRGTINIIATQDASLWYDRFGWRPVHGVLQRDPTP